jgi:hypothetical protein
VPLRVVNVTCNDFEWPTETGPGIPISQGQGGPNISPNSKLHYDWRSVDQSYFVSGTHLGPVKNFSFLFLISLDSCAFVDMEHPGSVVYNCCWVSPVQFFRVRVPRNSRPNFYCLKFKTPQTWRVRFPNLFSHQQDSIHPSNRFVFITARRRKHISLLASLRMT